MKDKEKQIEEMAIIISGSTEIDIIEYYNALIKAKQIYEIIFPKDSVVLSREELNKRDYEFRQIGYDECLRDNPKKDKYIKTLERKIDQLNAKLDQARKETAEKILKMFEVWEDKPYVSKEDFKRSIADLFGVEVEE